MTWRERLASMIRRQKSRMGTTCQTLSVLNTPCGMEQPARPHHASSNRSRSSWAARRASRNSVSSRSQLGHRRIHRESLASDVPRSSSEVVSAARQVAGAKCICWPSSIRDDQHTASFSRRECSLCKLCEKPLRDLLGSEGCAIVNEIVTYDSRPNGSELLFRRLGYVCCRVHVGSSPHPDHR